MAKISKPVRRLFCAFLVLAVLQIVVAYITNGILNALALFLLFWLCFVTGNIIGILIRDNKL